MFPDELFTNDQNVELNPAYEQPKRILIPSIAKARNKKDWNPEVIDLKNWRKRLLGFKEIRLRATDSNRPRAERREASKYLGKTCQLLSPLAKAGMRARWLEVETGLIASLRANDRISTAIMARSLIEEAHRCQLIASDLLDLQAKKSKSSLTSLKTIADRYYFWVLPQVDPRTVEELKNPTKHLYGEMDSRLKLHWDTINDYVHPNYGSHRILTKSSDTIFQTIIVKTLKSCYEIFFEISWLSDSCGTPTNKKGLFQLSDSNLAKDILPHLAIEFSKQISPEVYSTELIDDLVQYLEKEERYSINKRFEKDLNRLEVMESELEELAILNADPTRTIDKAFQLFLLQTDVKQRLIRDRALEFIKDNLPLASAALARSVVEHHAVQYWLVKRSQKSLETFVKTHDKKYLHDIAGKLARCIVGTKQTKEPISEVKNHWDEIFGSQKVNLLEYVKTAGKNLITNYDYLSSVTRGIVLTGGDCLSDTRQLQTHFFAADAIAKVYSYDPEITIHTVELSNALDYISKDLGIETTVKLANKIKIPDKFKKDRDYFGEGTLEEPYHFRDELFYHSAVNEFLKQKGFDTASMSRVLAGLKDGDAIDEWSSESGSISIFTKNKTPKDFLEADFD